MVRSLLFHTVKDRAGNAVQNAAVYAYQTGTVNDVTGMWDSSSGGTALSNPLKTNGQGEIVAWLDTPQRVDLKVTDNVDKAYYPTAVGSLLSFADFTETVDVPPPPAEVAQLDEAQTFTGAQTFSGAATVSDKTSATNIALRPATGDAVLFVSTGGNDSNDGRSWGSAKATLAAALSALPADGGLVHLGAGTYNFSSTITVKQGVRIKGAGGGGYQTPAIGTTLNYTGTGTAIVFDGQATGSTLVVSKVGLEGFRLKTDANIGAIGIHLWSPDSCYLKDIWIQGNWGDGIKLDGAAAPEGDNLVMEHVHVNPTPGNITNGLNVTVLCNSAVFTQCQFWNADANGKRGIVIRNNAGFRNVVLLSSALRADQAGAVAFRVDTGGVFTGVFVSPYLEVTNSGVAFDVIPTSGASPVIIAPSPVSATLLGSFPTEGLVITADGVIHSGADGREALRLKRTNSTQTANILKVLKQDNGSLLEVGPKGSMALTPDATTGTLFSLNGLAGIGALMQLSPAAGGAFTVGPNGEVVVRGSSIRGNGLTIHSLAAADFPLWINQAVGQSSPPIIVRNSADTDNDFEVQAGGKIRIGAGTAIAKHLSATAAYDPPSVAAGAQTTTTVTVTGAALGDTVAVGFSLDLQGMQLTGYVSAADTVTAVLRNGTAGAIDLASGTLRADVWKH